MNPLHSLIEGDVDEVVRNVARIKRLSEEMAIAGSAHGFEIYKLSRNTLEILAFDRISRDTLARLGSGREVFCGYDVSDIVRAHMKNNQRINAIKEFRSESGLGLREAKDWVEAYMQQHAPF
jgi:ribosomal protein L7/L12